MEKPTFQTLPEVHLAFYRIPRQSIEYALFHTTPANIRQFIECLDIV